MPLDPAWLTERIAAGLTTADIAVEAGTTDRTVRYAIARHELARPARQGGDIDRAVDAYLSGIGQDRAIAIGGVSVRRLRRTLAERGIPIRPRTVTSRESRYPELNDPQWLAAQAGRPLKAVAREVGCDRQTLRKALRRHGIRA